MNFSPKKFLTSIRVPPSVMAQLMGKCAYTALILYRYPLVTPLKRLVMWEQTVLTSELLLLAKPLLYLDSVFIKHINVHSQMLEALGEGAPGSLD